MKKILFLLVIIISLSSCSENETKIPQEIIEFPTNITIPVSSAEIGGTLTINGNGFLTDETYIVNFSENVVATIIELNTDFILVEIPENATSGDITLTLDGQSEVIGTITIAMPASEEARLFGYNKYPEPYISTLNIENGNEILNLGQLPDTKTYFDFVYLESSNEIVTSFETTVPEYNQGMVKINIDTNELTTITFSNQKGYKLIKVNSRLFGYNQYPTPYITELNIDNGNEILNLGELNSAYTFFDFVYLETSNEIVASFETEQPEYAQGIIKINLDTKEKTTVIFPDQKGYKLINANSRVFGYNQYPSPYISEIDLNNGNEILNLGQLPDTNTYFDFVYLESSNEIIASFETTLAAYATGFVKLNLDTQETTIVTFSNQNSYKIFSE